MIRVPLVSLPVNGRGVLPEGPAQGELRCGCTDSLVFRADWPKKFRVLAAGESQQQERFWNLCYPDGTPKPIASHSGLVATRAESLYVQVEARVCETRSMANEKVRWAVFGAARIATRKVIPALQKGEWSEVIAIASRDLSRARQAAADLGIPKAFGSYEEVLADPAVEAVYIPLPNHMHVPWSIRAAQAGKHVLCE